MVTIPEPSYDEVSECYKEWKDLQDYSKYDCFLNKLFTEIYPNNVDTGEVLIKVRVLDSLYSTNIGMQVYPMDLAEHIVGFKIDQYIKSIIDSDSTLVNEIALVEGRKGKDINLFSFATKYCSFHFQEDYPIYDSHVSDMLKYFKDEFAEFTMTDLRQYPKFYKVMEEFQKFYGLEEHSLRKIEKYLWYAAKYRYSDILRPKKANK